MKKKLLTLFVIVMGVILYFILGKLCDCYIPCIFRLITGFDCPGCGITRMIIDIIHLDFYHAFRHNMLLFVLFPFIVFFVINYVYCLFTNKKPLYLKIPNIVWYILIGILIIWGIIRNIFPYLGSGV